jgi:predicted aldo/keto reductase-like oxidoreductase
MNTQLLSRRDFLQRSAALASVAALCPAVAAPAKKTASDQVTLGKTSIKLSRLGMGVGTNSGEVQRALGREGFNRLVRYAYDQGITYIDTADSYKTHEWVRDAIKGLPREKLFIQTKMPGAPEKPLEVLDRYRKELDTDYIDSLLLHYATTNNWHEERKRLMDAFAEAQEKKLIRVKGVSCHGLPALTRATQVSWIDVHLVRLNPQARRVDGATFEWDEKGNLDAVVKEVKQMRAQGRGIIGMKLIGNGEFTDPADREKSIRFAMRSGLLDAAVIGFKSPAEIDEAIERINRALAEV